MLTQTEENYLKLIYLLGIEKTDKISVTALAQTIGNNPASVIDMLKRLKEKKLIEYDKVRGAILNNEGKLIALHIIRMHRLWESFLQNKLGYTWDEVHDLAEQLEHVQDANLADRLDHFLGHPQFDPHGEPIPSSSGEFPHHSIKTLLQLHINETCKVVSVKDTSKNFLQYLKKLNIGIGSEIQIMDIIEFDGTLSILIDRQTETNISEKFASNVFVNLIS